jgi:hypothetical protein
VPPEEVFVHSGGCRPNVHADGTYLAPVPKDTVVQVSCPRPVLVSLGCTPASAGTRQELTSSRSGGPWQIAPKEAFVFIAWTSELMLLVLALASQQSQRSLRELLGLLLA